MSGLEIDQFTTPESWNEFRGRFDAVVETIGALGLQGVSESEGPALLFGGGALAMNMIDAYVPNREKKFDLDIIVPKAMFGRLEEAGLLRNRMRFHKDGSQGVILPSKSVPLRVDVISSSNPDELRILVGNEPYTGEPNVNTMELDGVRVLWPSVVAMQKVKYQGNRVKDLSGVIKAHAVAFYKEHPILEDELWQEAVSTAVERVTVDRVDVPYWRRVTKKGPAYPSWLSQLKEVGFEHPAFVNLPH